jgi:hypothetical protein
VLIGLQRGYIGIRNIVQGQSEEIFILSVYNVEFLTVVGRLQVLNRDRMHV